MLQNIQSIVSLDVNESKTETLIFLFFKVYYIDKFLLNIIQYPLQKYSQSDENNTKMKTILSLDEKTIFGLFT